MFDRKYEERLKIWSDFRQSLEHSTSPLEDVIEFYKSAPYVSIHTDPWDQKVWPGPWQLLMENQYCDFVRVLGMCYSLQLTERFKDASVEIHIGIDNDNTASYYLLVVDDSVIGWNDDAVVALSTLPGTYVPQRIYHMPSLY